MQIYWIHFWNKTEKKKYLQIIFIMIIMSQPFWNICPTYFAFLFCSTLYYSIQANVNVKWNSYVHWVAVLSATIKCNPIQQSSNKAYLCEVYDVQILMTWPEMLNCYQTYQVADETWKAFASASVAVVLQYCF